MNHIPRGSVNEIPIFSTSLNEKIDLLVYLPAHYSPIYKYSLLIAQDGRDYFQLGRIARFADELHHNQEIENVIIVGIPYQNVVDRRKKYHPNGEKNENYIRFLAHELVPFLEERFPTYHVGMGRALVGDSLAGTVSLLAAIHYPHTFGKVILQSPYVNEDVLNKVAAFSDPHLLNIYHVFGKNETEVKLTTGVTENFVEPNRKLANLFQQREYSLFSEEFFGNHTWTYWQPDLKRALKHMFS
ncbi:esterase family protein [Bacillus aquiflavi]|uniref:Esterase family protein n=1 Tax=Bacillus aquiflavi TaxID=2672567 RepID=A0A6B3VUW9_9BACI|nr:alpha/beta hydrolase-fold protein [Bacillus aquiflavi]MBA4536404.1 esterase family protein [Bacillus aquiflavi]NEY80772.1 esterase family protein [Bacillus aquiflavi]UAC49136.1 esterase family protein [Bacillus aquiflavi]